MKLKKTLAAALRRWADKLSPATIQPANVDTKTATLKPISTAFLLPSAEWNEPSKDMLAENLGRELLKQGLINFTYRPATYPADRVQVIASVYATPVGEGYGWLPIEDDQERRIAYKLNNGRTNYQTEEGLANFFKNHAGVTPIQNQEGRLFYRGIENYDPFV
jgi:hypothetical protein